MKVSEYGNRGGAFGHPGISFSNLQESVDTQNQNYCQYKSSELGLPNVTDRLFHVSVYLDDRGYERLE